MVLTFSPHLECVFLRIKCRSNLFFQLLDDPAFIPITALETHKKQPQDFEKVLVAMEQQKTGNIKITKNATRAISVRNSLIWRPTEYSHYFFTHIPGKCLSKLKNITHVTLDRTQWSSGRVLVWCVEDHGFDSRPGHTKDFKNGTWCLLAKRSAFKG